MRRLLVTTAAVAIVAACSPASGEDSGNETDASGAVASADGAKPGGASGGSAAPSPSGASDGSGGAAVQPTSGADQPCTLQNTMGVWSLIHIEAAEPGAEAFYQQNPYEYMRISATGAYGYFAGPAAARGIDDINNRLDHADAADGVNDRADFRQPGLLVVTRDGQPFQAFTCMIAGSGQGRHQAGDMVWTEYQGLPDLYRVQRRIQ